MCTGSLRTKYGPMTEGGSALSRSSALNRGILILMVACVMAVMLVGVVGTANAAPASKCRNNPENFSKFHGKCLSDKKIERLKERGDDG